MEQYPIPQFIEQEAKIAFFISFRQFFYLVGAGMICFILYFILPKFLFWLLAPIIFIAAAALAFVKINETPLLNLLMNSLGFMAGSKNYIWRKKESLFPFKTIKRLEPAKTDQLSPSLKAQHMSKLSKIKTGVELRTK